MLSEMESDPVTGRDPERERQIDETEKAILVKVFEMTAPMRSWETK